MDATIIFTGIGSYYDFELEGWDYTSTLTIPPIGDSLPTIADGFCVNRRFHVLASFDKDVGWHFSLRPWCEHHNPEPLEPEDWQEELERLGAYLGVSWHLDDVNGDTWFYTQSLFNTFSVGS